VAIEALRDIQRVAESAFTGGGAAVFLGDTTPSTATYRFWVTSTGAFYVADGSVWVQIPGTPGADGVDGADATPGKKQYLWA
jgi:hypothetical protein